MTFRVGQKVVCINTAGWNEQDYLDWSYPRKGEVVTISGFGTSHIDGSPCISLAEHPNPDALAFGWTDGFSVYRFRPIVERKTDISIFTKMLGPKIRERA